MTQDLTELFGPAGPLARSLPGYAPRDEQLAMAEHVAAALEGRETLIVEAGTGTGKTFAYLVPALLSGRRVILSTGTRALQDQLYHRDLLGPRRVARERARERSFRTEEFGERIDHEVSGTWLESAAARLHPAGAAVAGSSARA